MNLKNEILIRAEKTILSIAINSPNSLPDILSALNEENFLYGSHKIIFNSILKLNSNGEFVSLTSISKYLEENNQLLKVDGVDGLIEIAQEYYSDEILDDYIKILIHSTAKRKIEALIKDTEKLLNDNAPLEELLTSTQNKLLNIDLESNKAEVSTIGQCANSVVKKIKELESNPSDITGVGTGFTELDKLTFGWQPADLVILAARPSMGKTALALNLAYNAANYHQDGVAIFSIEMPAEQLVQRVISSMTSIDSYKIRTGKDISNSTWKDILKAEERLKNIPIFIDDSPGITVQQIHSKLNKLRRDHGIKLCIIDYLQLISSPSDSRIDRQNEISTISRQLKKIARDTGVAIICLSQLSRSVEKREDKRPIMSDLRDSGAIEQDADIIMFLYREEYYANRNNSDENFQESNISETELIISKHRNGATGVVQLKFDKQFGKFNN